MGDGRAGEGEDKGIKEAEKEAESDTVVKELEKQGGGRSGLDLMYEMK